MTKWHHIFGAVLQEYLSPIGIEVIPSFTVSPDPPEADILLLQQPKAIGWTEEQRARLPDGIRDHNVGRVIIEFKYTESVTQEAFDQLLTYLYSYRRNKKLPRDEVLGVLVSSKTTNEETLKAFGYSTTGQSGVYRSTNILLADIPLLLLNELSDGPHNLMFKLFASRRREKAHAIDLINRSWRQVISNKLAWTIEGLSKLWFMKGGLIMEVITPELLMEKGRELHEVAISIATKEDWIAFNPAVQAEIRKAEQAKRKAEQAKRKAEQAKRKAEQAKRKAEQRTEQAEQRTEQAEQAKLQISINVILEILTFRFDVQPSRYEQRLADLALPALEQLRKQGLAVDNLAEFDAVLAALEQSGEA